MLTIGQLCSQPSCYILKLVALRYYINHQRFQIIILHSDDKMDRSIRSSPNFIPTSMAASPKLSSREATSSRTPYEYEYEYEYSTYSQAPSSSVDTRAVHGYIHPSKRQKRKAKTWPSDHHTAKIGGHGIVPSPDTQRSYSMDRWLTGPCNETQLLSCASNDCPWTSRSEVAEIANGMIRHQHTVAKANRNSNIMYTGAWDSDSDWYAV